MLAGLILIASVVGLVVGLRSDSGPGEQEAVAPAHAQEADLGSEKERDAGARPVAGEHEGEPVAESDEGSERVSAAAELAAQNAYPKGYAGYATARAGLKSRAATLALPERLTTSDFRPQVSDTAVRAQAGTPWNPVGPVGVIPGAIGYPTAPVVSGRVTALVVDPQCGVSGHGCRMWMGAAGGGVWRTPDAAVADPQWAFVSGDIPSTAIGSLALDPNDTTGNTIYAGTGEPNGSDSEAGVGLYKSTDAGDHWSLVSGSRAYAMGRSIGSIAIKPGDPDVVIMGTGSGTHGAGVVWGGKETPPNGPAVGVYASTNGGGAFSRIYAPPLDNGSSQLGNIVQLAFDPSDSSILYASVMGYGVMALGASGWRQVYAPIDPDYPSRQAFTLIDHSGTVHMYVLDGGDIQQGVVKRTLDVHQVTPSWTLLTNSTVTSNLYGTSNLCGGQCTYNVSIAGTISATGGHDVVWAGGLMAYDELVGGMVTGSGPLNGLSNGRAVVRSENAEAVAASVEWTDMTVGATTGIMVGSHPDQHVIALNPSNPDQAFMGSDGGLVRTDGGFSDMSSECAARAPINADPDLLAQCQQLLSWVPTEVTGINSGLSTLQVVGVASSAASPGALMAGFQDNGTAINGGGAAWTGVAGGDGGQPAFDLSGADIAYQQYYSGSLFVSYSPGTPGSWLPISGPMEGSGEHSPFYAALLTDPVIEGTVFAGWQSVWRSTDRGGNRDDLPRTGGDFAPMGPKLTDLALGDRGGGAISTLARTTGDTTTLWAATSMGRVFVSKNATAPAASVTFTRIDDDSTASPTRFPSAIEVDPADVNHAWVSYAGYNANTPTTPGHLFEVRFNPATGTSTWADRSYDLGDVPLRDMTYDPLLGDIYASGDWGVLRLPGGATSWMDAGSALPQVATYNLSIEPEARVLYAGTHGRGVYTLTLPDPAPGPAPPAPMPAAAAFTPGATALPTLSARVLLPRGGRVTAGANGTFVIQMAATSQSGTGTITLNGALQPTSGRPTSTRLARVKYRFTRNHATRVSVRLPAGSRRVVGRAGRMNVTAKVVMRSTVGEAASTTARMVLVASPRLRANSR